MVNLNNITFWLNEQEQAPVPGEEGNLIPPEANLQGSEEEQPKQPSNQENDVSSDPQDPDVDSVNEEDNDFQVWQKEYFKLAVKANVNEMKNAIGQVRDRKLEAPQRRFVEDNLQILLLREDSNFDKASREIRKLINQELDRNNPAVSLTQHIMNTLQSYPLLQNIFIKLSGQGGLKNELHRRFIAALLGAVQYGGGGRSNRPDLILPARDYSVDISTRFANTWGDIAIGKWNLQEDDPEEFLSNPELERLQNGSPEEKHVLRRRICIDSIAKKFENRSFIIHMVNPEDGSIHALGWDISENLQTGYREGKLVVRKRKSQLKDAIIDDNGEIIPLFSYAINYKDEKGELSAKGESRTEELPFMEQRDGMLYLTADSEIIQQFSGDMAGMFYSSYPYNGNPSDVPELMRTAPSTVEMLLRRS